MQIHAVNPLARAIPSSESSVYHCWRLHRVLPAQVICNWVESLASHLAWNRARSLRTWHWAGVPDLSVTFAPPSITYSYIDRSVYHRNEPVYEYYWKEKVGLQTSRLAQLILLGGVRQTSQVGSHLTYNTIKSCTQLSPQCPYSSVSGNRLTGRWSCIPFQHPYNSKCDGAFRQTQPNPSFTVPACLSEHSWVSVVPSGVAQEVFMTPGHEWVLRCLDQNLHHTWCAAESWQSPSAAKKHIAFSKGEGFRCVVLLM